MMSFSKQANYDKLTMTFIVTFTGLESVEVGSRIPYHAHEVDELILVYSGEAALEYGESEVRSSAFGVGSLVFVPKGVSHSIANRGAIPLELLWAFPGDRYVHFKSRYK
eukprot:Plantae.Rhodophyta-Hildenbrandia_rubra.ctg7995.p1 GENE.Plantae.Rhodophyta-Hildenbrandia_rubra.ctg7995~~Plantae.Rhodophyta-Hildenbrandia_rubra.ctg7995.p1  ORF type:complete len:109 (-),score=7.32 Plantae.Rhodophyta-Hildenbrandia_rubra.ctg7995:236-562(-)